MNIAFFLTPKLSVSYIYDDFTLRQATEKMRHHGYTTVPIISRDGKYAGVLSEGDIMWHIIDMYKEQDTVEYRDLENVSVRDVVAKSEAVRGRIAISPVRITVQIDELVSAAMRQNFVPVIDDNDMFIGIVTRRAIIKHLYDRTEK